MPKTLLFLVILIVHWVMQFLAWSYAESSGSMRVLWNVLATPLVHVTGSLANEYFWAIASLNSFLWAAALTFIIDILAVKP